MSDREAPRLNPATVDGVAATAVAGLALHAATLNMLVPSPGDTRGSGGNAVRIEDHQSIEDIVAVAKPDYRQTPDGRYFVKRGRLWRRANPALDSAIRQLLVKELMSARRAARDDKDEAAVAMARRRIDDAKVALGERGPVWWDDGVPRL